MRRPSIRSFSAGDMIGKRYRVQEEVGAGNFAKVVRAEDTGQDKPKGERVVALKMLKPDYAKDAEFELEVLQCVTKRDPRQQKGVCWMLDQFEFQGMPCFVFRLHGPTLKSRRLGSPHATPQLLSKLARRLASALRFLHFECSMVHTDLKPENILVTDPGDRSPIGEDWTVCDLGSASFYGPSPDQDLISTRPYRSPEILVTAPWAYGADMWSFGCIMYEVAKGRKLFDATDDGSHLHQMQGRLGPPPRWLGQTLRKPECLFDKAGGLHHAPRPGELRPIQSELQSMPELADLIIQSCLYDPAGRLRADEALHHPFLRMHAPAAEKPPPLLPKLPQSGYTSGRIKSPCGALSSSRVPVSYEDRMRLCERSFMPLGGTGAAKAAPLSKAEEQLRMAREEHARRRRPFAVGV